MNSNLLTAIIAAGAALLGAAIGQFGPLFQQWLSRRHERRVMLRQKYEQMAMSAANLLIHLDRRITSSRSDKALKSNPELIQEVAMMHTLAQLYFPELVQPMQALQKESLRLDLAFSQAKEDEVMAASTAFAKARTAAMEFVQKYANRYT